VATHFWNPDAADNTGNGLTFATAKKDLSAFSPAPGDTIKCKASPAPVNTSINCTFNHKSINQTLSSAVTTNLYREGTWTAATNVTCTTSTTRKVGATSASIAIASGFTTGIVAYFNTGTLDLSNRQQISVRLRTSVAISANVLRLRLSSTTNGTTATNEFVINRAMSATNTWYTFVFDYGSALASSIASIALVADSDPGTPTILFDVAFVSKAPSANDSLTLNSLVGKNAANENWYGIAEINGTTLVIDSDNGSTTGGEGRGYTSFALTSSETVPLYKRECFLTTSVAASGAPHSISASGTVASPITISGGWDTTDMSTQTGFDGSFFTSSEGLGFMPTITGSDLIFEKISVFRYERTYHSGTGGDRIIRRDFHAGHLSNSTPLGNARQALTTGGEGKPVYIHSFNNASGIGGGQIGFGVPGWVCRELWVSGNRQGAGIVPPESYGIFIECVSANNQFMGYSVIGSEHRFYGCIAKDNVNSGFDLKSSNSKLFNCVTEANSTASIRYHSSTELGANEIHDHTYSEATLMTVSATLDRSSRVTFYNDGVPTTYWMGYLVEIDEDTKETQTKSTKVSKTAAANVERSTYNPVTVVLATLTVPAGQTTVFNCRVKRSATGLAARLRVVGGQAAGVGSAGVDITDNAAGVADLWETLTITIPAPTYDSKIDVLGEVYENSVGSAAVNDAVWFEKTWVSSNRVFPDPQGIKAFPPRAC
jgi:hypothetical protein